MPKVNKMSDAEMLVAVANRFADELCRFNDLREREIAIYERQEIRASRKSGDMQVFLEKAFEFAKQKAAEHQGGRKTAKRKGGE